MNTFLNKKSLKKALKNMKTILDENGNPIPVTPKIYLLNQLENKRKEKP